MNERSRWWGAALLVAAALLAAAALPGAWDVLAAAASGSWRPAGSMATDRSGHTATLLDDGNVLVTGGITAAGTITAGAELFDSRHNSWSPTDPLGTPRLGHAAIRLDDGRVLVVGGLAQLTNIPQTALASAELYDPVRDTWSQAAPMPVAAIQPSLTVLPDSRVLVAGGSIDGSLGSAAAAVYDPVANGWTAAPPMSTPRRGPAAILLRTGKVLLAGGAASDQDGSLDSAELYDPATNSWSQAPPMSSPHAHGLSAILPDGTAMVAGGVDFQGGFAISIVGTDLYNPAQNSWSQGSALRSGRASGAGALLSNGMFLAAGGYRVRGGVQAQATAEVFDSATRRWTEQPPMAGSRTAETVTALAGGRALVAGGSRLNDTELFAFTPVAAGPTQPATVGDVLAANRDLLLLSVLLLAAVVGQAGWRRLRRLPATSPSA